MTTPQQRRRRRELADRRKVLRELYPRPTLCAIRWDDRCQGAATDPHEPITRGRGGSITDRANIVAACHVCHELVHAHPAEAERRGWLVKRAP